MAVAILNRYLAYISPIGIPLLISSRVWGSPAMEASSVEVAVERGLLSSLPTPMCSRSVPYFGTPIIENPI
jgi:hypothetical protein